MDDELAFCCCTDTIIEYMGLTNSFRVEHERDFQEFFVQDTA